MASTKKTYHSNTRWMMACMVYLVQPLVQVQVPGYTTVHLFINLYKGQINFTIVKKTNFLLYLFHQFEIIHEATRKFHR